MNKIGRSWSHLSEIKVGVGLEKLELFCVEAAGFYSHCCARKNFLDSKIISDTFFLLQPAHCMKEMSPIILVSSFFLPLLYLSSPSGLFYPFCCFCVFFKTGDRVWAFPGFCNKQMVTDGGLGGGHTYWDTSSWIDHPCTGLGHFDCLKVVWVQ